MSEANAFDFGKFIPGFDFLQQLAAGGKGAAGPVSALHHWVAPTISVEELDKRIKDLKAVLFWLEQNGTALKATIQALEVQKMTLATLQGMNVSMAEVAKAFTIPTPDVAAAPAAAAADPAPSRPDQWPFSATPAAPQSDPAPAPAAPPQAAPAAPAEPDPEPAAPAPKAAPARKRKPAAKAAAAPAAPLTDPLQWWGALTQQFQHIAANALRDAAPVPTGAASDAPDSVAEGGASKAPTAKKTARKGAAAKRPAKKVPAKPARKAAGKKAAPAARKSPSGKTTAADPAAAKKTKPAATGWPLPPPFKFGR